MKNCTNFIILCVLVCLGGISVQCSQHVLFIHLIVTKSHLIVTWPIAKALVAKGYQVTFITTVDPPESHPNITVIKALEAKETFDSLNSLALDLATRKYTQYIPIFPSLAIFKPVFVKAFIGNHEIQEWMDTNPSIDLIMIDCFPELALGLAHKLNTKLAVITPVTMLSDLRDSTGVVLSPSSTMDHSSRHPLSFLQRLRFMVSEIVSKIMFDIADSWINTYNNRYLNVSHEMPSLDELRKNISLVFYTGYPFEEFQKAVPPNYISIAGIHVQAKPHPLPKEIETFVSSSPRGFVYISLGTLVDLNSLSTSSKKTFFDTIEAFPEVNFVWKWDVEIPDKPPKNVKFVKWLPQQDLLADSRILAFVTQTGRPSSQEALHYAVPMITLPVQGDQDYNAMMLEELGVSINLNILTITTEDFVAALQRIFDGEFKARCNEISMKVKDVPMKPLDTAVWWIEYILRHNSTSHLQPLPTMGLNWIQRRQLDTALFLLCVVLLAAYINFKAFKVVYKKMTNTTKHLKEKMGNKKNN